MYSVYPYGREALPKLYGPVRSCDKNIFLVYSERDRIQLDLVSHLPIIR